MTDIHNPSSLLGKWESTDAFGNTALDWSQALRDQKVTLVIAFGTGGCYSFQLLEQGPSSHREDGSPTVDRTSEFRHVVPATGHYRVQNDRIFIDGNTLGIQWTFQLEEDDTMRIRLEGAKRFGRCKGVDVIYFKRVEGDCE